MEEKRILPENIELPETVLAKSNHAFAMIRQENVVNMKKEKNRRFFKSQVSAADETTSLLGKKLNIKFENLGTLESVALTNAKDGVWEFDMELPTVSSATHIDVSKEVEGTAFTVTDVDLSPISMKVNYVSSGETEKNEDELGGRSLRV